MGWLQKKQAKKLQIIEIGFIDQVFVKIISMANYHNRCFLSMDIYRSLYYYEEACPQFIVLKFMLYHNKNKPNIVY